MDDKSVCRECNKELKTPTERLQKMCISCAYLIENVMGERSEEYNQMEEKRKVENLAKQKRKEEQAKIRATELRATELRATELRAKQQAARNSPAKKKWSLYFIAHINDLPSIIEKGILSPNQVRANPDIHPTPIADPKWQAKRSKKFLLSFELDRKVPLDDFAHTFFFPRNPMLFKVMKKEPKPEKIVVIKMRLDISDPKLATTLNNAASYDSTPYESWQYDEIVPILEELKENYEITRWWKDDPNPEYQYLLMSECLIPREVPSNTFEQIHVYNNADIESNVQRLVAASKRPQLKVVQDPRMFFNTW